MNTKRIGRPSARVAATAIGLLAAVGGGLVATGGALAAGGQSGGGVVISEVYGGGGDSGSTDKNDFIELQNRGSSTVSLAGWSVQYHSSSSSSTDWQVTDLTNSLAPGGVYLISEAAGGAGTEALPVSQASGSINLSATAGTVALVKSTNSLDTSSTSTAVADSVDLVGYGAAAIYEDSPAPMPSDSTSDQRTAAADNSDNATDFVTATPTPGTAAGGTTTTTATTPTTTTATTPTTTTGTTTTPTGTTTTPTGTTAPTLITEPNQGLTPIYDYIQSATKSIDMTMYALQDTTAEDLLGDEAAKGLAVRVILDGSSNEKSNNTPAYNYLQSHGVDVVWSNPAYTYTHEKSIIVDDSSIAIMTLNLQSQYYSTSRDFAVIDHYQNDVNAAEAVFDADFAHQSITPSDRDDLVWSPTDSQSQLLKLIDGASSSLVIENEEMDDTDIEDALESAAERGVNVEVIMTNDDGEYDSAFDALTQAGVHVVTYAENASLYVHAKVIIADDARAFVGSENFSDTSLNDNRELGLITTNASILSSLENTLASDYAGGTAYSG